MGTIVQISYKFLNCLRISVILTLTWHTDNEVGTSYVISLNTAQNGPETRITYVPCNLLALEATRTYRQREAP